MNTVSKHSKLSVRNNRKLKIFLFFLVLTSIIWLLIELSKTYTSTVSFKVEYTNLPNNKLLQSKPVSTIDVAMKAPGFSLVKHKLIQKKISLNLKNLLKNNSSYYILPNNQLQGINTQLPGDVELTKVLTDTIFFELGLNVAKKVPVNPNLKIEFKLGYNLIGKLKISPDSIVISGPQKNIDSIKEVLAKMVSLNDVYETIDIDLDLLLPPKGSNVKYMSKKVKVIAEVDKFTEGSFKIPVVIINEPENVKINPFPKEIEVVYQAGLSNFSKINENSIAIVFDYKQYENDTLIKYLTPIVKQKSEFISSINIHPRQIEFLIQKEN
jgi:hypothetical protein